MDALTRELIRRRAQDRCEYCRVPQAALPLIRFHVEHVVAKQHLADDSLVNLALACDRCNFFKGPNLSSMDPDTGAIIPLFHPRRDSWDDHFCFVGPVVTGLTATGRVTARLLQMNAPRRVELRRGLLDEGAQL